jgi:small subunit ribosomal protein S6
MILSPEATEEELAATVERVDGLITDRGGAVGEHESWGLRQLAFLVKEFREGNYVMVRFTLDAGAVSEFKTSIKASEDILRFLVTRV